MFQGTPGVSVEWPAVLYPAPLPQYEGLSAPKPAEPPKPSELSKDAAVPNKTSGVRQVFIITGTSVKSEMERNFSVEMYCLSPQNKKRKSRGKGKKTSTEESRAGDGEEDDREAVPALQRGRGKEGSRDEPSALSLYPSWKKNSSDSEFSDPEGNAQSKLRYRKISFYWYEHAGFFPMHASLRCLEKALVRNIYSQFFLFQALPQSCASESTALSAVSGEMCREKDSVRVLVLLHPRLSYRGAAASHSAHNYTEGPLTNGRTYPRLCYGSPRHVWL